MEQREPVGCNIVINAHLYHECTNFTSSGTEKVLFIKMKPLVGNISQGDESMTKTCKNFLLYIWQFSKFTLSLGHGWEMKLSLTK